MPQINAGRAGPSPSELVSFLRARFQDDWNHARDAMMEDGRWRAERTVVVLDTGAEIAEVFLAVADHIARFDPARVMREVEAKRALLDAYEAALGAGPAEVYRDGLQQALSLLASVYAEHADFREW